MRRSDHFPSRRHSMRCPTCGRLARIPLRVALFGLVPMLVELGLLIWLLAATGMFEPETVGELVVSAVALIGGLAFVMWTLSLLGAALTDHLE